MCSKNCLINSIDMMRNDAWRQSLKYRYDPFASEIFEKQLQNLSALLEQALEIGNENIR